MPSFPRAYTNKIDVNETDPMMKRVPADNMGIASRPSGMPDKDQKATEMTIQHVGNSAGGSGS
jgi:hypothetical protein